MNGHWHMLSAREAFSELGSSEDGLSGSEAESRLLAHGKNKLEEERKQGALGLFLKQFRNPLVYILILAAVFSFFIGHVTDGCVISAIVLMNALLGFRQEYKAERVLESLKSMVPDRIKVVRSGETRETNTEDLVPGDVMLLEEGDKIPADGRIIWLNNFTTNEAALTGESQPVNKTEESKEIDTTAEIKNMVFAGTVVTSGRAKVLVTDTGMDTRFGKIAKMVQRIEVETPLQRRLGNFANIMGAAAVATCILVSAVGIWQGRDQLEMILVATSLAISAIPEGLPAIVTITLALGTAEMAKRNAVIRRLPAVESLGSVNVICVDKTGTLTKNEMTLRKIFVDWRATGITDETRFGGGQNANKLIRYGALCNNAHLSSSEVLGDPTDAALLVAARKAGMDIQRMKDEFPRLDEMPLSSEKKRMTTLHALGPGMNLTIVKGAPEVVLGLCNRIDNRKGTTKISEKERRRLLEENHILADQGLRVIALAYKRTKEGRCSEKSEHGLTFLGLFGLMDPPREGVKESIEKCRAAGIRVIMLTGDQRNTALAIAKEIGMGADGKVILGSEIDEMPKEKLKETIQKVSIFARITPEHKLKIIEILKEGGNVVAMTGDGVNDAPALKLADIGVSMGIKGTDVARESSDMVLMDDDFTTIVNAIEEGRKIYANIRKFVRFQLASNLDEIIVASTAIFLGLPLPLVPVQILWINLVTDGLPALALSVDPPERGIMSRKPRNKDQGLMDGTWMFVLVATLLDVISSLTLFLVEYSMTGDLLKARTMAFTAAVVFELFFVFNCRSEKRSVFKTGFFENKQLLWAVLLSFTLQLMVIYIPFLQAIFQTTALSLLDWTVILAFSSIGLLILPDRLIKDNG